MTESSAAVLGNVTSAFTQLSTSEAAVIGSSEISDSEQVGVASRLVPSAESEREAIVDATFATPSSSSQTDDRAFHRKSNERSLNGVRRPRPIITSIVPVSATKDNMSSHSARVTETTYETWTCDDTPVVELTEEDRMLLINSPNRKGTGKKNFFGTQRVFRDRFPISKFEERFTDKPDGRYKRGRTGDDETVPSSFTWVANGKRHLGELTNLATSECQMPADKCIRIRRALSAPEPSSKPKDVNKEVTLPVLPNRVVGQAGNYISPQTVADVMSGKFNMDYEIIDCRFPYEFEAGHISGAKNLYTQHHIRNYFLDDNGLFCVPGSKCYIIHCEFSQERGPKMFGTLRNIDRAIGNTTNPGAQNFPLKLPNLYVLYKGYRAFKSDFPELCTPFGGYRMMKDDVELLKHYKSKTNESERFFDPKKPMGKMARHNSWSCSPSHVVRTTTERTISSPMCFGGTLGVSEHHARTPSERTNSSPVCFGGSRGRSLFDDDDSPSPRIRRKRSCSVLIE